MTAGRRIVGSAALATAGNGLTRLLTSSVESARRWQAGRAADHSSWIVRRGNRVLAEADANGHAPLFFASNRGASAVGTDPVRVACAVGLPCQPDPQYFAEHFSMRLIHGPRAPISDVSCLEPGFKLAIDGDRCVVTAADESPPELSGLNFEQHVLMTQDCLRRVIVSETTTERPGILLSAGVDSFLVARTAMELALDPVALSWGLPDHHTADESGLIRQAAARLGIEYEQVELDDRVPGFEIDRFQDFQWPSCSPYEPLREALGKVARQRGLTMLMSGDGGDNVLSANRYRLIDALRLHYWRVGAAELATSTRATHGRPWRHQAVRALAPWIGVSSRPMIGDWLTPEAASRAARRADPFRTWPHPEQMRLAHFTRPLVPPSIRHPSRGVRSAYPYHDRRMIRLLGGLPAQHLLGPGGEKRLFLALAGDSALHYRARTGLLDSLFDDGVFQRHRTMVYDRLFEGPGHWTRFVDEPFLRSVWQAGAAASSFNKLLLWYCLCFEIWLEQLARVDASTIPLWST